MDKKINSVGYCGLHCPECYKMKVSGAARILKKELEMAETKGASFFEGYSELRTTLDGLIGLRCTKFCRQGGGKSLCEIRECCLERGFKGCWECSDFGNCKNLKEQFVGNIRRMKEKGIVFKSD
ncbi:MAG: DUF3795 domain-containing protein [Candidatus Aenigmarchaeota archaeon]|nr:DUF3795 domain-containing protein [Candidatus Aenigmarchaeota archaeon]